MNLPAIDFVTLGCSKNLVDSEVLMGLFERNGFHCTHDPRHPQADIAVINTCGFIEDAKQESIDIILEFANRKDEGRLQHLYVMGCLSQRYQKELEKEIPQVDKWYGKFNFKQLLADLSENHYLADAERKLTTPPHYAYIKIGEGCNRQCAYCAIPMMTGKHVSRRREEILDEVRQLARQGVKEFQLIAQELTYYGVDIDGTRQIAPLVSEMADIEGVEWIRLHYAYPNDFPMELLDVMNEKKNVCRYLDIALQHISDSILERMRRHVTKQQTVDFIHELRSRVPGIHLRTTLMVGFPGETEEDFNELMDFVRQARFERMGAFAYSEEDGTYSARHYKDNVPAEVKQDRLDRLMSLQQQISEEIEAEKVGTTMRVIIDRKEGEYYVGRSEFCSPEVDPEVLIHTRRKLRRGHFYDVRITDSEAFDLFAEL
ncbi:MAG: 30S ribosomal protein S12 methylthiotransferase RimO [Prevotella sp.]|nr:30S ribosomal protein S12 methylthiotransferase RimO [Prevotella sp.]